LPGGKNIGKCMSINLNVWRKDQERTARKGVKVGMSNKKGKESGIPQQLRLEFNSGRIPIWQKRRNTKKTYGAGSGRVR